MKMMTFLQLNMMMTMKKIDVAKIDAALWPLDDQAARVAAEAAPWSRR